MKVYVVIPGKDEEKYIGTVLKKVKKHTDDVIFVDDGSADKTPIIARKHTAHVVSHEVNLGKGAAMKTGADYAFDHLHADAVVFMDADDQHEPSELVKFFEKLRTYDVVFGIRNLGANVPLLRFLGNKFASIFLNILYGAYIPDIPSGYKGFTRNAYKKIEWVSQGYEVETEIAMRVAKTKIPYTTVDISTIYHDTDKGMTMLDGLHICRCLVQWRVGFL